MKEKVRCWCISDTHGLHNDLIVPKDCEMLLFCGDATNSPDTLRNLLELRDFIEWLDSVDVPNKVVIPGNHDVSLERLYDARDQLNQVCTFLEHGPAEVCGLNIFGSAFTPAFGTKWAFNLSRAKIGRKWKQIPEDTDVLLTHGPCLGLLDSTICHETGKRVNVGCKSLLKTVMGLNLRLHCCGHIHNTSSSKTGPILNHAILTANQTKFVNASVVDDGDYQLKSNGFVIEI